MSEAEKQGGGLVSLTSWLKSDPMGTCGVDGCEIEVGEAAESAAKSESSRVDGIDHKGQAAAKSAKVILPGSTIGILGGGQLGRMMANAGSAMGYRFIALDPTPDAPCGQVAEQIIANYDDRDAAHELAKRADVITYEFENVDAGVAAMLMEESYVPQGSELLYTTQHRLREKRAIEAAGVKVAPYCEVGNVDELRAGVAQFGLPCVLKTATGGYDGKGQWVIRDEAEIDEAFETLNRAGTELVLEQFIRFEKELSVIAARSPQGEIRTFPAAENIHIDNILHLSIVPARVDETVQREAERLAARIAEGLGAVGLIAVELFLTADGELFVNELAPRPHNSGHYTMEACRTSQFEQHVRAVCGLPLGDTALLTPVVMVNVLGEHVEPLLERMAVIDEAADRLGVAPKVHLYGKHEAKHKRKMGHVNVLAAQVDDALAWITETNIWRA
ncbi:N5-carboxyaminoimidazole ribonucleotide synthase [Paenibacillus baekrokdamisoli]|uniref:N5-carboxyaminoimidazole ribonucleotide synthase n=1 Tax=Paenibacillus baekrokdamisoli TaxID=1712516 RepID=A0A3G9IV13_9BACL|nr:5-(carboxyamino)imidazole ribonucleotide synthase [Paenibacillus baekrokdamisoli]MBB3068301.1 5-(carboxyamino)imidazole ribonucleotide synthase [Paenibacillus baekrokdamisoli]BBH22657.1 N5-carboxyaminoimidazole ribonucleotide synthase [Paenibacillus baekrokdamisoli]